VHDILANTIRSNELIMNGEQEGKTFYDVQEVGEPYLMITFDQALLRSYEQGIITEETAIAYSTRKSVVQRGIDHVKQKRGEKTTPSRASGSTRTITASSGSGRPMANETHGQVQFGRSASSSCARTRPSGRS